MRNRAFCRLCKMIAIINVPEPTNTSDIRRFLGMANQLSKFSPSMAEMTKPLQELLCNIWGEPQHKAFEDLKKALSTKPKQFMIPNG